MKKIVFLFFLLVINNLSFSQNWEQSNFFSSNDNLAIDNIKIDNQGNYYLSGTLEGEYTDQDTTITADGKDIFLAKFDLNFNKIWIKVVGGTSNDQFPFVELDKDNNLYLLGTFQGICKFSENDSLIADFVDAFIVKYNSNGIYQWSEHLGSNSDIQITQNIAIDKFDNIVGSFRYRNSATVIDTTVYGRSGVYNNLLFKISNDGTLKGIKSVLSNNTSLFTSIKAFSDGYYIDGQFQDSLLLDVQTIVSYNNTKDVFLYKTDFDFNGQWVRRSYGNDNDFTGTITQDNYGNIYYTGFFNSDTLRIDSVSTSISNVSVLNNGNTDIYITKYNKSGNLIWLKGFGGNGSDWARSIKQKNDYLFLSGYFSDTLNFGVGELISSDITDLDFFLGYLDLEGNVLEGISLETSGILDNDSGTDLLIEDDNSVVVAGYFKSENIFIGDSLYTNSNIGFQESFIGKYIPSLATVFTEKINTSCNGDADGELIVTPYFGVAPYTYTWSHNGSLTDSTATGLSAATYTVTVTDGLDSTAVVSYDLPEPDPITFNPLITDVTMCSYSLEGAIDLNVAGGNSEYSYVWQAIDCGCGVFLLAEDQSGLSVGTYNVTVTDSKSCTADTVIYILGPDPITFSGTIVTDSSELGGPGAIDLVYSGGFGDPASFTFAWEGPSAYSETTEDIFGLYPGNYSVTTTDAHACEFDTTMNVANLDTFYIFISDYKDACNGTINGSASVSYYSPDSHTGITYLWDLNTGSQTTAQAINLTPGRYYYVSVTDTVNDPDIVLVDSVYIDELAYNFAGSLSGTSTLDCLGDNDGFVDLSITSAGELPYTYNWSNTATTQDITNLSIGTYGVTVTDKYNCTFSITNYTIDQPEVISAVAEIVKTPSCNGDFDGEITVDRSGGTAPYTYQWDDPGFQNTRNADGLDAGYYSVTVSDVNGCENNSSINLTQPEIINADKTITNELCNSAGEGAISLMVTGGTTPFSYSWTTSGGSGLTATDKNQTGLIAGKYYFTATDDNNCLYNDSAEITEPSLLQILTEEKTDVFCNGDNTGTITVSAAGGTGILSYTLNPGAIQTNSTGSFVGLYRDSYTVNVEDENFCSVNSVILDLTEPSALSIIKDDVNNLICNNANDGSIYITVNGGTLISDYSYDWTTTDGSGLVNGEQDQLFVGAGTYYLTVLDDYLCEATESFILTEPDTIIITKTVNDISCSYEENGVIIIYHSGGNLPFSYLWTTTDGSGLDPISRHQGGLSEGTYTLEITDAIGCVAEDSITLISPQEIIIDSVSYTDATGQTEPDGTIQVFTSGGTGSLNYILIPGYIINQIGAYAELLPNNYTIEVTDDNNCGPVVTDTIAIGYPNAIIDISKSDKIKIFPNPTSDKIFIEINFEYDKLKLEVLSISGQILYNKEIVSNGTTKEEINLSNYPKGIYFIRVYNNSINFKEKIIIQ